MDIAGGDLSLTLLRFLGKSVRLLAALQSTFLTKEVQPQADLYDSYWGCDGIVMIKHCRTSGHLQPMASHVLFPLPGATAMVRLSL